MNVHALVNQFALFAIDVVGDVSPADAENLFGLLEAAYPLNFQRP